jgi:hypothetical protein
MVNSGVRGTKDRNLRQWEFNDLSDPRVLGPQPLASQSASWSPTAPHPGCTKILMGVQSRNYFPKILKN